MGVLKVIKASGLCTIQDEGRIGYRQYGIPQSGAMDKKSMHLANSLVGNHHDAPVIESAIQGFEIECEKEAGIAITGAKVECQINQIAVSMNKQHQLQKGDILSVGRPSAGNYSYLAIAGILKANQQFGSVSTYLTAGFGGLNGTNLKEGDVLETAINQPSVESIPQSKISKSTITQSSLIRILKGPEWRLLKDFPENRPFKIDPASNRMGIRLNGDPLAIDGQEIISSAVVPGTIQLPKNGLPIVLMNDCQTTGGYPRIGKVIDADMGKLAQIEPGKEISFQVVSLDEARVLQKR